jgi:acetyl esterase/lipase
VLPMLALVLTLGRPSFIPDAGISTRVLQSAAVRVEKDMEYGRAGGESLKLDLYLPAEDRAALRPGIVFIHGGGWSGGDKSEFADMAREMAGRGYVAVSVNYRLAPKYRFPANVEDVQKAVRWLRRHAAEYRLDPARIGAMGASAGGHLASMLGLLETRETGLPPNEPPSRVECVVDYFGRMDLTLEPTSASFTEYRVAYIGKSKSEAQDLYVEASPITHVDPNTVPFLLVHGARDPQVEPVQSEKMLAALERAGIEASLLLLGGQGHGFRGAGAQMAWDAAKAFLDRHLMK